MNTDVINSCARKLNEGTTNLMQVRVLLYNCNWFSSVPTDREAIDLLNEYTDEDFDAIKVAERELSAMLEPAGLSLLWEMDGTYQVYDQDFLMVAPIKYYNEMVDDYGPENVVMANEDQDEILTSARFDELYLVLC